MAAKEKPIYSLIPLDEFKAVLGVDDRDDKLARFCLVSSTFSIEQYCKRRFLRKKHFETLEFTGDLLLPFKEYPVSSVLAVYALQYQTPARRGRAWESGTILEPEFYSTVPECGTDNDIVFSLSLSPALKRYRGLSAVKVAYWAGYAVSGTQGARHRVPADLASACLELASWNMNRYKGRRIGTTGNIRGTGKDGEHFEPAMPENVKHLLEPYRRRVI